MAAPYMNEYPRVQGAPVSAHLKLPGIGFGLVWVGSALIFSCTKGGNGEVQLKLVMRGLGEGSNVLLCF